MRSSIGGCVEKRPANEPGTSGRTMKSDETDGFTASGTR